MFELLYVVARPFIWNPLPSFLVACVLLAPVVITKFGKSRRIRGEEWPLMVAAAAWVLFGINEYFAFQEQWNIRVDILFIWPILIIGPMTCVVIYLINLILFRRSRENRA